MKYTMKLPLHNNNSNICNEKTEESSPMFTISSFSPDTTRLSKYFSSSSLRRIGAIKLLILALVIPIMILTIVNPMWICIFMEYPHVHNITTPVNHAYNNNVHTNNLSVKPIKPKTHTHAKSYKGGIRVTQETLDVIVASKDGHRLQELETTITVIENIPPKHKQISKHRKETANSKAQAQINKPSVITEVKNNDKSIINKIRERLFKDRNNCAYVALSVITLCAVIICGIVCLSSDNRKTYESVNDDDENQPIGDHYIRVEDCDDEKFNENSATEIKTDARVIDYIRVQVIDNDNISTPTSSPPPYSSSELSTTSSENIQQSADKN